MYRKILIGGVTAAAIVGAGGTALALSGSDTPATGSGTHATAKDHTAKGKHGKKKHGEGKMLRRLAHGQFVTKGKDGKFVTHDLITGTVTSVSSSSITVQAADKKSETFSVGKDTKVRERTVGTKDSSGKRTGGKATDATISSIAKGDHVMVVGTGSSSMAAQHITEVKGSK